MSDVDMEEDGSDGVEMDDVSGAVVPNLSRNAPVGDADEILTKEDEEGPANTSGNSPNRSAQQEFHSQLEAESQNSAPLTMDTFDFGIELPEYRPYVPLEQRKNLVHLFIRAITTENFKSYGGKKFLGPFDEKFTAIIGPNGCGKSNTIDALLFVFGFRSNKLRTRNLRELIHTSEGHNECTSTKVTVHFTLRKNMEENQEENNDGNAGAKFEGFDVSRTINRNNVSHYYLNTQKSSYEEITKKLRHHGIDLNHNRFLILQGEVESLALMKPSSKSGSGEGMLEYLEGEIESNRYKEPLEKADELLSEFSAELEQSDAVHHGLKTDLTAMFAHKLKAEKFLERQGEYYRLQHLMLQIRLHLMRKTIRQTEEELKAAKETLKEKQERVGALVEQEKNWRLGKENIFNQLKEMKKAIDRNVDENKALEAEKMKIDGDLKSRKTILTRLEKELATLKTDIEQLEVKQAEDTARKAELEQEKVEHEEKIIEASATFKAAQEEVASSTKALQATKKRLEESKKPIVAQQDSARTELDMRNVQLNGLRRDAIAAENRKKEITERLNQAQLSLDRCTVKKNEDEERVKVLKAEIEEGTRNQRGLTEEKRAKEASLQQKNARLNALEDVQVDKSTTNSSNAVVREMMQCKSSGTISGILGRLGDLGAVDKRYEIAISAVGGGFLDHIVVDTADTSKRCVEHLRRTGAGRGNFLVLEKTGRLDWVVRNMNAQQHFPAPRLFDMIKLEDPTVKPLFYYALRDCLVADNLDKALEIAPAGSRYKVATLGGQIIDPSGAMTGGGSSSSILIRIGQQVLSRTQQGPTQASQAELTSLEEECQQLSAEIHQLGRDLNEVRLHIPDLEREREGLTARIREATRTIQTSSSHIASLPAELEKAERRLEACQTSSREEQKIKAECEQLTKDLEEITARVDAVDAEIANVDKNIWDVRGEKVRKSEKELQKLKKKLTTVQTELTTIAASLQEAEVGLTTKSTQINRKQEQVEETNGKLADLHKTREEIKTKIAASAAAVSKSKEDLKDGEASLARMQTELDKAETEMETAQTAITKVKKDIETFTDTIALNTVKITENEPRLEEIKETSNKRPFAQPVDFSHLSADEATQVDFTSVKEDLRNMKGVVERTTAPNLGILEEFVVAKRKFDEHLEGYKTLKGKVQALTAMQKKMTEQRTKEFTASFDVIQKKLKETYRQLTLGGDAELVPVNNLNIFGDGIEFSVRPPNKSWKSINNLSGGEKTLSSLSLIFALHHYKPTPFYIMDEIDAALDYRNVAIVGTYVKERALDAQFLIVSLRPNMYQQASRHIGIFKTNNVTQVCVLASDGRHSEEQSPLKKKANTADKDGEKKGSDKENARMRRDAFNVFAASMRQSLKKV